MKFERELLKGVAPAVVLEVLSRKAMYGYELSDTIARRSNDILTLGRGTLYPLLYNLEAKGWIKGTWQQSESGRQRRYYAITAAGSEALDRQKQQWEQLQAGANMVLGIQPA